MRRIAWWLAAAGSPCLVWAQTPRVVIDETFVRLDPSVWVPATNGPLQSGAPTSTSIQRLGDRSALMLESELAGPMRLGFLWTPTFRVRSTLVEFGVMPLSLDESPAEAILMFPFGDVYLAMSLHATPEHGPVWVRVEVAGWAGIFPTAQPWTTNRWYTYMMDVGQRRVRLAVSDDAGARLWAMDFPWELCEYAPEWTVGVLQGTARSERVRALAAFDRVQVTQRCGADIDGDGALTALDFSRFLREYAINDCSADMTDDAHIDIRDAISFTSAFAAGCP